MPRASRKRRYCSSRCSKAAYRLRKRWRKGPAPQAGCVVCGESLDLVHADERTCSDRCRQRLSRARAVTV